MAETKRTYYNDNDPYVCEWTRNLIKAGLVTGGIVDGRSIKDVKPEDLTGYRRVHMFSGIAVWDYALRLAGWPDDRPVWTGSCPCQPFSAAGKRGGTDDPRHLWPDWFGLIRECHPPVVFGEQVASKNGLAWLDLVYADLEGAGYAVAAVDLCAASVGAPHIRQRLYFVAHAESGNGRLSILTGESRQSGIESERGGETGLLGDTRGAGLEGRASLGRDNGQEQQAIERAGGFWSDLEWLPCRDGKLRPTQPGLFPLAHGAASRVGRLRAYGNAIVAPLAAEFIRAYMEMIS